MAQAIIEPTNIEQWGAAAHGVGLHIDGPVCAYSGDVWTIDVENNQDGSFAGIGLTADGRNIFYLSKPPEDKDYFKDVQLVGHNAKYDIQMLRKWGYNVSADQIIWDTQIAEYVRNSTTNEYGLKDLAKRKFGAVWPTYKELCGTGKKAVSIGTLPVDLVANYNCCDVLFTYKLYQEQLAAMSETEMQYLEEIELPTMRVLLEMEERGIQIDTSYLRSLNTRFADQISSVLSSIRAVAGAEINLNSPIQVKRLLLDKAGLNLKSTAAEELHKHENVPLVKDLLRYRQLTKLKGTYTSGLVEKSNGQETYRLHARFNQTVTHTGRLSSSEPNLQNIPTRTEEGDGIRQGFVPRTGNVFVDADYSQIEPRLMAHFSGDEKLLEIFRSGQDLYDMVAQYVGCDRSVAKVLWLAIAYNAGAFKISIAAHIAVWEAQDFIDKLREEFPALFYWKDKTMREAEIAGGVTTLFGRFIPLSYDHAHLAPNYKVQGSAAEINKLGLIATRGYKPVLNVHDEIAYDLQGDASMATIKNALESVVELKVPLICEIGSGATWREAKQ